MDQTSALTEYAYPLNISGAIYSGDPNIVLVIISTGNYLQNPKSANLNTPSLMSTFSGFKSLCMILYFLNIFNPTTNSKNICIAFFYSRQPFLFSKSCNVPPSQYS